jgi:arylformamidase
MKHESARHSRFIDLSHPLLNDMPVAPGLPRPRFEPFLSHAASRAVYAGQAEFEITRLYMVGNTGTSIDSPYHRQRAEPDVSDLPLERLAGIGGRCLAGDAAEGWGRRAVSVVLEEPVVGLAVLLRTGWDRRWGSADYWAKSPFLAADLVDRLIAARIGLVGVDFANVDDPRDLSRPAHTRLLAAGIPIVENMRGLERLPAGGFSVFAVPLEIRGAAALPVRVIAELSDGVTF